MIFSSRFKLTEYLALSFQLSSNSLMLKMLYNHYNPLAVPVAKAPHSLTITLPNARAKGRGRTE